MSDTQEELQAGEEAPLVTMWFETHLGARYEMPDMLRERVDEAHRQLDTPGLDRISVLNISEAMMFLPKRIIKKAGVGKRCFWEAT